MRVAGVLLTYTSKSPCSSFRWLPSQYHTRGPETHQSVTSSGDQKLIKVSAHGFPLGASPSPEGSDLKVFLGDTIQSTMLLKKLYHREGRSWSHSIMHRAPWLQLAMSLCGAAQDSVWALRECVLSSNKTKPAGGRCLEEARRTPSAAGGQPEAPLRW